MCSMHFAWIVNVGFISPEHSHSNHKHTSSHLEALWPFIQKPLKARGTPNDFLKYHIGFLEIQMTYLNKFTRDLFLRFLFFFPRNCKQLAKKSKRNDKKTKVVEYFCESMGCVRNTTFWVILTRTERVDCVLYHLFWRRTRLVCS